MVQYSSLFSSGFLAPRTNDFRENASEFSSTTQGSVATSSAITQAGPRRPPKIFVDTQMTPSRQKLRRRRSSLTAATSPISAIKSPSRSAGMSFSRALLMSPGKSRDLYDVDESSQNYGRLLHGGTLGKNIRSRRGIVRKAAGPAPLKPLPALPTNPPSSPTHPDFDYAPQTAPPVMTRQFMPLSNEMSTPDYSVLADVTIDDATFNNTMDNNSNLSPDETHIFPDFSSIIYHALTTPPLTPRLDATPAYPWGANDDDILVEEEMI